MAVSTHLHRLFAYRPGRLAWGTVRVSAGMLLRAILQAGVLVVLARAMGVERYGGFVATLALTGLFVPLSGSGGALLLVRDTARDSASFRDAFGRGLLMLALTGPLLAMISTAVALLLLPHGIALFTIVTLAVSELIFAPAVDLAARAYQGFERTGRMALLMASLFLMRLIALLIVWAIVPLSAHLAALAYAGSGLMAATFAILLAARELGIPKPDWKGVLKGLREGIHFGINYTAFRIHADIDKVMLARLDSFATAGFFTVGYRVVQMVLLPIRALLESAYARLFRIGKEGADDTIRLGWRLLPVPFIYALLAGGAIFVGAGLAPTVLGADFQPTVTVIRWLAALPVIALLRYGLDVTVSTGNRQRLGARVMMLGAAGNIGLNLWFIPLLGWKGAVLAIYGSEVLMLITFGTALGLDHRRTLRNGSALESQKDSR